MIRTYKFRIYPKKHQIKSMIPVALDATNHDILQASGHEKWDKIGETGKLSVSY